MLNYVVCDTGLYRISINDTFRNGGNSYRGSHRIKRIGDCEASISRIKIDDKFSISRVGWYVMNSLGAIILTDDGVRRKKRDRLKGVSSDSSYCPDTPSD